MPSVRQVSPTDHFHRFDIRLTVDISNKTVGIRHLINYRCAIILTTDRILHRQAFQWYLLESKAYWYNFKNIEIWFYQFYNPPTACDWEFLLLKKLVERNYNILIEHGDIDYEGTRICAA